MEEYSKKTTAKPKMKFALHVTQPTDSEKDLEIYLVRQDGERPIAAGISTSATWREAELCTGDSAKKLQQQGYKLVKVEC